jgi:hypothetical protein
MTERFFDRPLSIHRKHNIIKGAFMCIGNQSIRTTLTVGTISIMIFTAASSLSANGRRDDHERDRRPRHVAPQKKYDDHRRHDHDRREVVHVRGKRYVFVDNRFHHETPRGLEIVRAPLGAIVVSLPHIFGSIRTGNVDIYISSGVFYKRTPHGYEVINRPFFHRPPRGAHRRIINRREYFVDNNIYYYKMGDMYTVCDSPENSTFEPYNHSDPMTIIIENDNGSRTPVKLDPIGSNQWKGPKGEIYNGLPSQEQLSSVYGL